MTQEEVLQKANEFCNEKSYTSETLTDDFKSKFSEFFSKIHADATADDENVIAELQFCLNTAFGAASKGITQKQKAFDAKENEYKRRIEELSKNIGNGQTNPVPTNEETAISKEIKEKLERLEKFEMQSRLNEKSAEVVELAKKGVRKELHKSLESYARDFGFTLDAPSEEQAKKLTSRFSEIFKESIGDIKPLAPRQTTKNDADILSSLPKMKV